MPETGSIGLEPDAILRCIALVCASALSDDPTEALGTAESFHDYLAYGDDIEITWVTQPAND